MKIFVICAVIVASAGLKAGGYERGDGRRGYAQAGAPASRWDDEIQNLRSPDVKVRLSAVEALGRAGYTPAAEYVAPLVTDPDDRVQFAAIDAELTFFLLEPIGERRVFGLTGGSRSRAQEAFDAGPLVRTAAPAPIVVIDNLIAAMRDGNARIRFDAVHAVGVIGEAPLPPEQARRLIDGLDHHDDVMRAATARVLGRLRVAAAGDKLIAALNDSSLLTRRYAAEALGLLREERAVQSLTELTAYYGQGEMAQATMLAIARIAHPSSLGLFRQRLSDPDPAIRRAAVEGAGRLRDRDSLPVLKTMITNDSSASVRVAAAFAVDRLGEPQSHIVAAAMASPATNAQARDYLLELGETAVPGIRSALGAAADPDNRADLLHVLGYIGGRDAAAIIEPYATDKNERVQRAAANAIRRLTGVAATTPAQGTEAARRLSQD
jgi:HEAT repeat protein